MNQTGSNRLVLDDDWSYWAQFQVEPRNSESYVQADSIGKHGPRLIALQNVVIGPGMLLAQRRRQLSPACDNYVAQAKESSSTSGRCLSHSENTVGFWGKQSGAKYNWVPQCDCYPAGIFGAQNGGTTLSEDRQRLSQLQSDGWLNSQTYDLKASLLFHNPTRAQFGTSKIFDTSTIWLKLFG